MITFKQAIEASRQAVREMFGNIPTDVEEIEVEDYHDRECWAITLSLYRDASENLAAIVGKNSLAKDYKRFYVSRETGEVLGVVIREVAVGW
ncbi:MAG: hypothetical protein NW208_10895 [Bryobacter sp.]|nr:hypothetical protein [Bryobacter sp.]